jgi:hypothetical protein
MRARTIVEIKGSCIETIPVGTEFEIICINSDYSACKGIGITLIWNDEYVLI